MTAHPWRDLGLIAVRGGGDLGTGVAVALHRAGARVLVAERPDPWCVRRGASVARALADGRVVVAGVRAVRAEPDELATWDWDAAVAVVIAPELEALRRLVRGAPRVGALVDARVLKRGHDTRMDDAPLVVGVGPGFTVGRDCHAAVETQRGPAQGSVVLGRGSTRPFSGIPGRLGGETVRRVLRAPRAGRFTPRATIGQMVEARQEVGAVDGSPVRARIDGVVRGLIAEGTAVRARQKVGDVDPRGDPAACWTLSDKAEAVGAGVVRALSVIAR